MARIENTSNGPREVHSLPKEGRPILKYAFTAARVSEDGKQTRINGVGEIPDDVLDELLAKDQFTKGLFDDGSLVRVGAPTPSTVPSAGGEDAPKGKGK